MFRIPRYFIPRDSEEYGSHAVERDGHEEFFVSLLNMNFWKEVNFWEYFKYKMNNMWRWL